MKITINIPDEVAGEVIDGILSSTRQSTDGVKTKEQLVGEHLCGYVRSLAASGHARQTAERFRAQLSGIVPLIGDAGDVGAVAERAR
jgi:hypothetical protein